MKMCSIKIPIYFGWHTQRCSSLSHSPLLAVQLFGQIGIWQASPIKLALHVHTESMQTPFPEHSANDVELGHEFKLKNT